MFLLLNKLKFEPAVFLSFANIQPWSVLKMFLDFQEFQPYVLINVVLIKKTECIFLGLALFSSLQ